MPSSLSSLLSVPSKKPYLPIKEPYISAKEPYISAKTLFLMVSTRHVLRRHISRCCCQCHQKSSTLLQKRPHFREEALHCDKRALYFRKRIFTCGSHHVLCRHLSCCCCQCHQERTRIRQKCPTFPHKSPTFWHQKSTTFLQKSPTFPQISPTFPQKSPTFPQKNFYLWLTPCPMPSYLSLLLSVPSKEN